MAAQIDRRSAKREEIRKAVTKAVISLLIEGGYEAVQIREVSARSNVSLRTIYKYFDSQQNLIAESIKDWWLGRVKETTISGDTFEDRILSIYRNDFLLWAGVPKLLIAFQRIQLELGPEASSWARGTLLPDIQRELAPYDREFAADFLLIIRAVMHQGMRHHEFGLKNLDQVWSEFERAVRRAAICRTPAST